MSGEIDEAATGANQAKTRYTVYAKKWIVHPNYNIANFAKDIGLVYLPSDVYYSTNADIARLYLHDSQISSQYTTYYLDKSANMVGFGKTGSSGAYSSTLKVATLKFAAFSRCVMDYNPVTPDSLSVCFISASTSPLQLPCEGDEGYGYFQVVPQPDSERQESARRIRVESRGKCSKIPGS
jgi:hypothetical protein